MEFGKACEDLSWNHCTSTPHWSETNGIAERAVRRVKEGTSAVLLQSGLDESWWADSMECHTYLRNVTDLLSDGKTPYEIRFGQPFKGPAVPFGSFGWVSPYNWEGSINLKESLTWIVPRMCIVRGEFGRVRTGRRHWGVLETMDASEIYSKNSMQKEVICPKENGKFVFPIADDESNFLEESRTWEHPPWYGIDQCKERLILTFLENQKGLFHYFKTRFRMPVKRLITVGPCQETSYTAITLNPESNFTRRERNHSLFHWSALTYPELLIRIGMSSKSNAWMIIGISMGQEICLVPGQVSHNLLFWKRKPPDGYVWSRWKLTRKQFTSRPDHLWPEFWKSVGKHAKLKEKKKWSWKTSTW